MFGTKPKIEVDTRPITPLLTVDVIIGQGEEIYLIKRRNPPEGWALPGGFVDQGESAEDAARREVKEEIGLEVVLHYMLGVYSKPDRDPRYHTASVVYIGRVVGEPEAGDDAELIQSFPIDKLPEEMCFDHAAIISDYHWFLASGSLPKPR